MKWIQELKSLLIQIHLAGILSYELRTTEARMDHERRMRYELGTNLDTKLSLITYRPPGTQGPKRLGKVT